MPRWPWLLLGGLLLLAVLTGLGAGPFPLSPAEVIRLLLAGPGREGMRPSWSGACACRG